MLKLEPRPQASKLWTYGSPLLALAVTVLIGVALFIALVTISFQAVKAALANPEKNLRTE